MIKVAPLISAQEAAPLLRELRPTVDEALFAARLAAAVAQGYRTIAASEGADMIGVLGYRITADLCWGRTFYIDDLIVAPRGRNRGVGALLLAEAHKIAAQDCDTVRLCSGLTRHDAHRFYEANGMTRFSLQFVTALEG